MKLTKNNSVGKIFGLLLKMVYFVFILYFIFTNRFSLLVPIIGAFISSFIIDLLCYKFRLCFSSTINILLNMLILAALLGEIINLYEIIPFYDDILHVYSGMLFTIIGYYLLKRLSNNTSYSYMSLSFICIFIFSFSITSNIFWEIFEFASDTFFNTNMQRASLKDTMTDIVGGYISAFITTLVSFIYLIIRN